MQSREQARPHITDLNRQVGTALIEVYEVNQSPVSFTTLQPVTNSAAGAPFDADARALSVGPDAAPRVVFQRAPSFPFELRRAGITGEVLVDFYVKANGAVANAVALRGTDFRFAREAVSAVASWGFAPGRKNGRLVTTHMQVPIIFTFND